MEIAVLLLNKSAVANAIPLFLVKCALLFNRRNMGTNSTVTISTIARVALYVWLGLAIALASTGAYPAYPAPTGQSKSTGYCSTTVAWLAQYTVHSIRKYPYPNLNLYNRGLGYLPLH